MPKILKPSMLILAIISYFVSYKSVSQELTLQDIFYSPKFFPKTAENKLWHKTSIISFENNIEKNTAEIISKNPDLNLTKVLMHLPFQIDGISHIDDSIAIVYTIDNYLYRNSYSAYFFLVDIKSKSIDSIATNPIYLADYHPISQKVAYVFENNLFIYNIINKCTEQITFDGKQNEIINGRPDWVYEEEFSFDKGFYWSENGEAIVYYKFDESDVVDYSIDFWDYKQNYPDYYTYKYPKVGEDNAKVSLHIYNTQTNSTISIPKPAIEDYYIPRVFWTKIAHKIAYILMNRSQNNMYFVTYDMNTKITDTIYSETNNNYIDITDDYFFRENNKLIFTSDKSAFRNIYALDINTKEIKALTNFKSNIIQINSVSHLGDTILFTIKNELNSQKIYRYIYGKSAPILDKNNEFQEIEMADDGNHGIISTSSFNSLPKYYGYYEGKTTLIENNKALNESLPITSQLSFNTFVNANGDSLAYWELRPQDFSPKKKYKVLLTVYGGPGYQTVLNHWNYSSRMWYEYLCQQGFIVLSLDPRGTGGKSSSFTKCTQGQLGALESTDIIEFMTYYKNNKFVDLTHVGIFGWSYGGFLSSLAITKGGDTFTHAVSVAPVTNWLWYDNIYTERYMGTLDSTTEKNYLLNSPMNYIDNMQGKLLLMHGMADDNVHIQHSYALYEACMSQLKDIETYFFPNKNHGIYGGKTRLFLYQKVTDFLMK